MGLCRRHSWLLLLLLFWVRFQVHGVFAAEIAVKFLKAPLASSSLTSATFEFEVLECGDLCSRSIKCKLDDFSFSNCENREASYTGLLDGNHSFEVCINGSPGVRCTSYNWTIDTVSPTAHIAAVSPFTNALNVSVDISFNKPCTGGGGFRCFENYCNLLVYGAGHVIPSTLKVLQPDLKYSLLVGISADVQYGRLVLVMDKSFCTDASGNRFTRTTNSSYFLHFDRRSVFVTIRTHILQKMLELNNETRTVEATNKAKDLKVYLYFSAPLLNSSSEVLGVLRTSTGVLVPANSGNFWNRRFGFLVNNISSIAVVTISLEASLLISRQGTLVSPTEPETFLYDAERPSVLLSSTSNMRTSEHCVPVLIKFVKPVFDFNSSAIIILGGHLQSFHEISRSVYTVDIHADDSIITVKVPENTTGDVAGNKNLASNLLQVRHYSVPIVSSILSTITTVAFMVTSFAAAFLMVSTASLLSFGECSRPSSYVISDPSRNLMRFAYHIQVFALSKWLSVTMPIEYYEFTRGIEWSIPYLGLPWGTRNVHSFVEDSNFPLKKYSEISKINKLQGIEGSKMRSGKLEKDSAYGMPLTPMEYRSFLENQNLKPEAEFLLNSQSSKGWTDFGRIMFWLAVIGGGLMVFHAVVLFSLKLRRKNSDKPQSYGALTFPRLEIFLLFLALPCICQASTVIIRGRSSVGVVLGVLLLGVAAFLLLALLLFISLGITMSKLLQYKEVHQEDQNIHWYQEIVRVTLGPGKRGQWTWKDQPNSIHLTKLGPLFEDLRGPPKYILSQISAGDKHEKREDRIIASEDETEDAEAPFIQKLFGIFRIYYTVIESIKRISLGIIAGAYPAGISSKIPIIIVLSITSFQLFFIVLKKPFIKKKVQFVEIISVTCELGVFGALLVLLEKQFSDAGEKRVGYFLLALFIVGFSAQMFSEWCALLRQVLQLSPDEKSLFLGLRRVIFGFLLILVPSASLAGMDVQLSSDHGGDGEARDDGVSSSGLSNRNSGTSSEKPWLRQLKELAEASFSREGSRAPTDPSSSQTRRSGFWSGRRSGSSSATADFKARTKGLQKDLEAIFSSK